MITGEKIETEEESQKKKSRRERTQKKNARYDGKLNEIWLNFGMIYQDKQNMKRD